MQSQWYKMISILMQMTLIAPSLVLKVRGFGIRKWPTKRELTKTKQSCHRNINNALVSLTCDLEISAVAESSIAPFSTNTPSPVIHVTQQITGNFHYSTRWLSSLSLDHGTA